MKIDGISGKHSIEEGVGRTRENTEVNPGEFQNLLEEELNPKIEAEGITGATPCEPPALAIISPVPPGSELPFSDEEQKASDFLAAILNRITDRVESHNQKLSNVEETIATLYDESDALQEKVSNLPKSHGLRQIADELGILAYVESVKWRRGDYL